MTSKEHTMAVDGIRIAKIGMLIAAFTVACLLGAEHAAAQQTTVLQAGDADQDGDFDQYDLVRTQQAAKYLTGRATTWGEGDWNGAPGGSPGNPPAGNGFFDQLDIIASLAAGRYLTGPYLPGGGGEGASWPLACCGVQGDGQTSIVYDPKTGRLSVDAPASRQLTTINIDSQAGIFTGERARNLGGSYDNDADDNIFKATFGGDFGSVDFGNVAQSGLLYPFVLNDLSAIGSLEGGGGLGPIDLVYLGPTTPFLMPGDANQDRQFDQSDLVQVLVAGKYATDAPATWGEGDWNGGPGGKPGNPPAGDGRFDEFDIMAALAGNVFATGPYWAVSSVPLQHVTHVATEPSWSSTGIGDLAGRLDEQGYVGQITQRVRTDARALPGVPLAPSALADVSIVATGRWHAVPMDREPVPEPSTWSLILLGLWLICLRSTVLRRRQRTSERRWGVVLSPSRNLPRLAVTGRGELRPAFAWCAARTPQNDRPKARATCSLSRMLALWLAFGFLCVSPTAPALAQQLEPGDADRDFDFDQFDIIQMLQAAKYLTGQPATWGEGDFDGDGDMDQLDLVRAQIQAKYLVGPYVPGGGGLGGSIPISCCGFQGDFQTSVVYDPETGELAVDAPHGTNLTSINIDSAGGIFTRDFALNLGGSFDVDSDHTIFKSTFGASFPSLSFGNVAQENLSYPFLLQDLSVIGSLQGGGDLGNVDLVYLGDTTPFLLPGDADQDQKFDQEDLVRVLSAGKYQSGQPATWGEGDWDGGPGGTPGNPPVGNGLFDEFDIFAALATNAYGMGTYAALRNDQLLDPDNQDVRFHPLADTTFGALGAASPVAVPEPATWMLLCLGASWAMAGRSRRARRQASGRYGDDRPSR
jgi:hypothetical protein